jgi:hypothetical protein
VTIRSECTRLRVVSTGDLIHSHEEVVFVSYFASQNSVHNNLAFALCNEVLLDTDPYNMHVLLRALTQLELILDDEIVLQNISTVADKVAEVRILHSYHINV